MPLSSCQLLPGLGPTDSNFSRHLSSRYTRLKSSKENGEIAAALRSQLYDLVILVIRPKHELPGNDFRETFMAEEIKAVDSWFKALQGSQALR